MHSIEIFLVLDFIFDLIFSLYFLATMKKHFQNANKKEEIQGKEQKYCRGLGVLILILFPVSQFLSATLFPESNLKAALFFF